ncbi:odorant receptor 42b-like [Drosophila sulfurigaster albostrigata]|uniref:odorant receptor 42b-like n=1 Tax=Drosophila sulfurigaster albostrigata TaxID=89887 RepID=UPI002D21C175|nr:odorant receptor 42b-like [Drosophila sulfurigaster albostrigata]
MMINYIREFKNMTPGELITSVQLMFNLPNCYIKAAILYFNLWRLEKAKEMLDEMDKSCTRQEEKLQVHRSVIRCNTIYLAFMSVYNFYPLSTFANGIINGVTPWSLYIPFLNWRDGTRQLWLAAIIEYFLVIFPVYYNNATDIYPVIYGQTIRLHFDLLIKRIQRLRCDGDKTEDKNYEELTGCIKDHKRILEYCDILRPLISSTIFFQFLVVGMVLGLTFTNLIYFSDLLSGIANLAYIFVYFPAVYNNAADIYPVIYGLTIRLHINLLIKRIELLRCDDNRSEEEHYEELTGCIKDHKRLLEYCNILRPLISRIIFVQFIMVGIIFGLCMTNLFFFADMWTCISTMSYIFGCIFQTFPFCYICNMMEDAVSDLTLSIFQSNWLGAPRRYKSSLLYFMHQSQQPIKFTAGSIFEISLATNINLAKFAFTVVTIVQQFNLAEKLDRK